MGKQQGMTLIGMLFTMVVVVMVGVVIMRIIPVYIQHYAIVQSIKGLSSTSMTSLTGDPLTDVTYLRNSLDKRFDINGVEQLKPEQITIVPNGANKYKVKLKYQVIKSLVYNMSLLFYFNDVIEVNVGSGA